MISSSQPNCYPRQKTSGFPQQIWLIATLLAVLAPTTILFSPQIGAATDGIKYRPPTRGDTRRTEGSGSRGCNKNTVSLNLLIPADHLPLTVSSHPKFLWYVSDTSSPVRFTLVEQGIAKTLLDKRFTPEKPGIVELQLPDSSPGLEIGKNYRWTVSIICSASRSSENIYAMGRISRIPMSDELKVNKKLAIADSKQRAMIYADAGVWYDALSTSFESPDKSYFFSLLDQINLNNVAQKIGQP